MESAESNLFLILFPRLNDSVGLQRVDGLPDIFEFHSPVIAEIANRNPSLPSDECGQQLLVLACIRQLLKVILIRCFDSILAGVLDYAHIRNNHPMRENDHATESSPIPILNIVPDQRRNMSDTNRHYFLVRRVDLEDESAYRNDTRFEAVAETGEWVVGRLTTPSEADAVAEDHLHGWGNAFYIRDPIGGGGSFTAYKNGKYGVERVATNGNRGGYHHVRKYILGHNAIDTDPPETLPTNALHE